jgi:hypothetical protein
MGWKDAFKSGNTASINFNALKNDNVGSAFGDAFANIGQTMIAADAQAGKNKLLELQLQNEQMKIDSAKKDGEKAYLNDAFGDLVARTGDKKGFEADKQSSLGSIEKVGEGISQEAVDNANSSVKAFYTAPSREAKESQDKKYQGQYDTAVQNVLYTSPDKKSFTDAFAKIKDDTMQLSPAVVKEQQAQMKAFDDKAQLNFNNELREKATAFKTFGELQNSDGYATLLANADAATVEHVIDRYNLNDKQKQELLKMKAEINHYQNVDNNADAQTQIDREKLAETKKQNKAIRDGKLDANGNPKSSKDDEKDIIKSIDIGINGLYGKKDAQGNGFIEGKDAPEAQWMRKRAVALVAVKGLNASEALTQAGLDFKNTVTRKEDGSLVGKSKPKPVAPKKAAWKNYQ